MVINKLKERKVRCDVAGCKNNAKYAMSVSDGGRKTYVCARCAEELFKAVSADLVPESPTSIFLKKDKETKSVKTAKGDK